MVVKVNNISMKLVQLLTTDTDIPKGLYLIPSSVSFDDFEKQVLAFDKLEDAQNDFDKLNTIGAQRVYAYDCMMDLNNF